MSRQSSKDRAQALLNMGRLEINSYHAAKLLRLGATLHRLAEAQCNGDWPADNGERKVAECGYQRLRVLLRRGRGSLPSTYGETMLKVSDGCGSLYVPSVLRKTRGYLCPDCCATEDAQKIAAIYGLKAVVNGDPRGMVLGLVTLKDWLGGIESGPRCGKPHHEPCTCHDPSTQGSPHFTGCARCGCCKSLPGADIDSGKVRPAYVY